MLGNFGRHHHGGHHGGSTWRPIGPGPYVNPGWFYPLVYPWYDYLPSSTVDVLKNDFDETSLRVKTTQAVINQILDAVKNDTKLSAKEKAAILEKILKAQKG